MTAQPRLLDTLLRHLKPVALAVAVISFFMNLLILPLSLYSLQIMDRVMNTGSMDTLAWLTAIIIAMFAVVGLLQAIRSMILTRAAEWLHEQITDIALPQVLAQAASGSKGAQPMRDAGTLKHFISGPVFSTLMDVPWSIVYIVALFVVHAAIGALVTAGAVFLCLSAWLNEVATLSLLKEASGKQIRSMQELELATRNAEVTEALGMSRALTSRWKRVQQGVSDMQMQATQRSAIIQGFTKFVRLSLQVLVTCLAAYLAIKGEVTIGAIIASSILSSRALAPFEAALTSWKSCIESRSAYLRLKNIFEEAERPCPMPLPAPQGVLTVEQVNFAIKGVERPILRNVNFKLECGELLGIVGPSGSGKSTLARLVLGVYPLSSGAIRLDGADIYRWSREELGQYIGYLPQDVELFGGSVKDNIARFRSDASPEAIVQAAQIASAHDLILRFPHGYDTEIGAGGVNLSAGQRQRIGLARALYGEPRLLVLDEPDANLDEAGVQALMFALNLAKQRKITTLLITHRSTLLAHVDKLLVLREGIVEAFGPVAQVTAMLQARQQPSRKPEGVQP